MTREEFNKFCRLLGPITHVTQWGGSDVWKIGGKMFAICGLADGDAFVFKVSDLGFEVLSQMPGLRPAPYMASRGLKWIQHFEAPGLSDEELKTHIKGSFDMIAARLPKKTKHELGLGA